MIAILDYGSGNLRSAERAFATAGKDVVVTSDRTVALQAEGLVVPGVGAFAACMNGLNAVDGASIVRERLAKERPTLGICIGMQIMFSQGTEHSVDTPHAGIGIVVVGKTPSRSFEIFTQFLGLLGGFSLLQHFLLFSR